MGEGRRDTGLGGRLAGWMYDRGKRWLPDELSLHLQHLRAHGFLGDFRNPTTFSEHVQARKLFEPDPRFAVYADKIRAKDIVEELLGPEWVIPTLWSGERLPPPEERNWHRPYVIKANHGCGWNLFIRSEADERWDEIERTTDAWLSETYKPYLREKFYADIPPRLLIEPLIGDPDSLPIDYKFFCYAGRVEFIMAITERSSPELRITALDRDWTDLGLTYEHARPLATPEKPESLSRMIAAAERLSSPFNFVRMDFYEVAGRPLFGEYSFTPSAGFKRFDPPEFNLAFGRPWPPSEQSRAPLET